jgi:hypothetical protein
MKKIVSRVEKNYRAIDSFSKRGLNLEPQSPNGDEEFLNEAGKRWFANFVNSERQRSEKFETFLKQNVRF